MNQVLTNTKRAYAILDWSTRFENAQSRKQKSVAHVLSPYHLESTEYRKLIQKPRGHTAFLLWKGLVEIATGCPQRGLLANDRGPLTIEDIALRTHLSEEETASALELLADPEIAWIEALDCPQYLIVSGSLRAGRKGRPRKPQVLRVRGVDSGPKFHIEWEYEALGLGEDAEGYATDLDAERRLPAAIRRGFGPELPDAPDVVEHTGTPVVDHISESTQPTNQERLKEEKQSAPNVVEHIGTPEKAPSEEAPLPGVDHHPSPQNHRVVPRPKTPVVNPDIQSNEMFTAYKQLTTSDLFSPLGNVIYTPGTENIVKSNAKGGLKIKDEQGTCIYLEPAWITEIIRGIVSYWNEKPYLEKITKIEGLDRLLLKTGIETGIDFLANCTTAIDELAHMQNKPSSFQAFFFDEAYEPCWIDPPMSFPSIEHIQQMKVS